MKTKRKYTKKTKLEASPVYKLVEKVWNTQTNAYTHGYLRGMAMVDKTDDIYDELVLLCAIKRIMANT